MAIDPEDMLVPRRWQMVLILTSGTFLGYMLRVNVSVAAVQMQDSLDWSDSEKGLLLSAFYIGYALGQLPSTYITHWYGAKWLFGGSMLLTSIFTLVFPAVIKESFSLGIFLRILIGFTGSSLFPSVYYFYKSWVPLSEKTLMIPFINCGCYLGEILCFSVSGYLVRSKMTIATYSVGGWPSAFWIFGLIGLVWFPIYAVLAYERPEDHPSINPAELAFIHKGRPFELSDAALQAAEATYSPVNSVGSEKERTSRVFSGSKHPEESDMTSLGLEVTEGDDISSPLIPEVREDLFSADSLGRNSSSGRAFKSLKDLPHYHAEASSAHDQRVRGPSSSSMRSRIRVGSLAVSVMSENVETEYEVGSRIPWAQFFLNRTSRTLLFAWWVMAWISFMMLAEIPSFLTDQLGYNIESAGLIAVLPYVAQLTSTLGFGSMFNRLQEEYDWSTRQVRQWAQFIGFGGAGIFLVACGFVKSPGLAILCLVLALFFFGACQSGICCAFLDVSPNYSSSLNSVANLIGAVAGILAPLVVAGFTSTEWGRDEWGWRAAFILTAAQCAISLVFWYFYQTSDVIPALNNPRPIRAVEKQKKSWW